MIKMFRAILLISLVAISIPTLVQAQTVTLSRAKKPVKQAASTASYDVRLDTIPHRIYKTNDGLSSSSSTESWLFNVLVKEQNDRPLEPVSASVELFSGTGLIKTVQLSAEALNAIRGVSFKNSEGETKVSAKGFSAQKEVFDLRHYFSEPVAARIDRIVYKLVLATPQGRKIGKTLEIPLSYYVQKTKLILPMKGAFVVTLGHVTDNGHSEWSQQYAYDIAGLGSHYELIKTDGETNEDFYGWGREILAPAEGVVVHVRNDVPDNRKPGVIDRDVIMQMPDTLWAVTGNSVVIDHGNGEFSILGHMQKGSIKVNVGDQVKQGEVLGLLGNSGNASAPHLHYHLMAGDTLFRSDPLPSHFENLDVPVPKRGVFLEAK